MRLAEVAEVVGGRLSPEVDPEAVLAAPATIDSRAVEPGGLFVALVGERVDGHDYDERAVGAGAAAVLASRPTGVASVLVEDPAAALAALARHVRGRLEGTTVLALTGSQGKTGTKDYLAQVLAAHGPTVATAGNFNNELGVPLTVLRATAETRYLVVEMGARHVGDIAHLCAIARPDVAAVLNVGTAHLGEFGSREGIARAKGEIVEDLPADGVAVLNADDPLVAAMAPRATGRVCTFGRAAGAEVAVRDVVVDDLGRYSFDLGHRGAWAGVHLAQLGAHQVANAAAAAAMALSAGVDLDTVADALADAVPLSRWRMEVTERADGAVVLNDAYNANPESMRAALATLADVARRPRRRIAVLGEMLELGDEAVEQHRSVGAFAREAGVDVLVAVGERPARDYAAGYAGAETILTPTRAEAEAWLRQNVAAGDVVLVKASRGAALEGVAEAVLEAMLGAVPDHRPHDRPDEPRPEDTEGDRAR